MIGKVGRIVGLSVILIVVCVCSVYISGAKIKDVEALRKENAHLQTELGDLEGKKELLV